jgi:hypothetical protein
VLTGNGREYRGWPDNHADELFLDLFGRGWQGGDNPRDLGGVLPVILISAFAPGGGVRVNAPIPRNVSLPPNYSTGGRWS